MENNNSSANTTLWDAFEHILLFVSLLVFSAAFSLAGHYFIDRWFPSLTALYPDSGDSYYNDYTLTLLRVYLSGIIVSLPFFTLFFLRITKKNVENPQTRNLKSRKTLIYITLVLTFIILLANTISLVYGFVSGNTTVNFLFHFVLTMAVSGTIFAYYLHETKEDRRLNV